MSIRSANGVYIVLPLQSGKVDADSAAHGAAGAIIQMTRCTALDAAKWGVRVNAICPGPILTDGTKRHADMLGVTLEEACREMTSHQIIPRLAPGDTSE